MTTNKLERARRLLLCAVDLLRDKEVDNAEASCSSSRETSGHVTETSRNQPLMQIHRPHNSRVNSRPSLLASSSQTEWPTLERQKPSREV